MRNTSNMPPIEKPRQRKANSFLSIVLFLLAVGYVVGFMFIKSVGDTKLEATIFQLISPNGVDIVKNFGEYFKGFQPINFTYLGFFVSPVVFSLLALIFRKFRLFQVLNVVSFAAALVFVISKTGLINKGNELFDYLKLALIGVGTLFSLVNSLLCK